MIDLRLATMPAARRANLAGGLSSAALFGVLVTLPFAFTAVFGFGPVRLAFATMPIAASYVIVAPIAGRAMGRAGSDRMAAAGFTVAATGACGWRWPPAPELRQRVPRAVRLRCGYGDVHGRGQHHRHLRGAPASAGGGLRSAQHRALHAGALGTAVLGTILHANLAGAVETGAGRAAAPERLLVVDGFRGR